LHARRRVAEWLTQTPRPSAADGNEHVDLYVAVVLYLKSLARHKLGSRVAALTRVVEFHDETSDSIKDVRVSVEDIMFCTLDVHLQDVDLLHIVLVEQATKRPRRYRDQAPSGYADAAVPVVAGGTERHPTVVTGERYPLNLNMMRNTLDRSAKLAGQGGVSLN
jgi:hypothetical protein